MKAFFPSRESVSREQYEAVDQEVAQECVERVQALEAYIRSYAKERANYLTWEQMVKSGQLSMLSPRDVAELRRDAVRAMGQAETAIIEVRRQLIARLLADPERVAYFRTNGVATWFKKVGNYRQTSPFMKHVVRLIQEAVATENTLASYLE